MGNAELKKLERRLEVAIGMEYNLAQYQELADDIAKDVLITSQVAGLLLYLTPGGKFTKQTITGMIPARVYRVHLDYLSLLRDQVIHEISMNAETDEKPDALISELGRDDTRVTNPKY